VPFLAGLQVVPDGMRTRDYVLREEEAGFQPERFDQALMMEDRLERLPGGYLDHAAGQVVAGVGIRPQVAGPEPLPEGPEIGDRAGEGVDALAVADEAVALDPGGVGEQVAEPIWEIVSSVIGVRVATLAKPAEVVSTLPS
jgi:hypothetical protein